MGGLSLRSDLSLVLTRHSIGPTLSCARFPRRQASEGASPIQFDWNSCPSTCGSAAAAKERLSLGPKPPVLR